MANKRKKHGADPEVGEQATSGGEQMSGGEPGTGGVSRRGFMVKTAEVAAMSLFGVAALDDVLRAVAGRVRDIGNGDQFARSVARELEGMTAVAWGEPYTCPMATHSCADGEHSCAPPFTCRSGFGGAFECDAAGWSTYSCGPDEHLCAELFQCADRFACSPYWCNAQRWDQGEFECNDPPPGQDLGFTCTAANRTFRCDGVDYHCNSQAELNQSYTCTGADFACSPADAERFYCGRVNPGADFTCTADDFSPEECKFHCFSETRFKTA